VIRYTASTVESLADRLGHQLRAPVGDPFAEDLVLTRSGGLQRWLAQRLSSLLGAGAHHDGVCARVRFATLPQFAASLRPSGCDWSPHSLMAPVMAALDDVVHLDDFAQVRSHLADPVTRPRRRMNVVHLAAGRFSTYARWNQPMLIRWGQDDFVSPEGTTLPPEHWWQAILWNRVCARLGTTPWLDAESDCRAAVEAGKQFSRIALFCPDQITPTQSRWLEALDTAHPIAVFTQRHVRSEEPAGDRVAAMMSPRLRSVAQALEDLCPEESTLADEAAPGLLGGVQSAWSAQTLATSGTGRTGMVDNSVQIHTGPADQQAEILSTVVVSMLARDPSLEPRDILVLVHQMARDFPVLDAYFRPDDTDLAHPRHRIRASVSSGAPAGGTAADLLIFLCDLVQSRAGAEDLVRLCSFPAVMAHFGFADTDLDRLSSLVLASGVRWGVNPAHRAKEGMAGFPQNTWMAGLGRMVLGVALSEDDLVYQGTVLPLDAVDSDTVRLIGALGQIITHVRSCCDQWSLPAEPGTWVNRFQATLDALTGDEWRNSAVGTALWQMGQEQSVGLGLPEAETGLRHSWSEQAWQSSFLNGDLAITSWSTMSLVPHKVVILVGLDAASFPSASLVDGDDIVRNQPCPQEDGRAHDKQVFYDALMSARETFIAICTGVDPFTGQPVPLPTPVCDLLTACAVASREPLAAVEEALVHDHGLGPTHTADRLPQPKPRLLTSPVSHLDQVEVDDLCEVYANPASAWLKRNAGVTSSTLKPVDPWSATLPVTLSALEKWQITNRMLHLLRAGKPPQDILQAELRRGTVPPSDAGVTLAQECLFQARGILKQAQPILEQELRWRTIDLPGQQVPRLTGQIGVRGDVVLDLLAGRVQPRHQIAAWVRILSLQVAYPDTIFRAVLVSGKGTVMLTAPSPDEAGRHLTVLRQVFQKGLLSPLPLPSAPSATAARMMVRDLNPADGGVSRQLDTEWERDPCWALVWPTPDDMWRQPPEEDETGPGLESASRFLALSRLIYGPLVTAGGVS